LININALATSSLYYQTFKGPHMGRMYNLQLGLAAVVVVGAAITVRPWEQTHHHLSLGESFPVASLPKTINGQSLDVSGKWLLFLYLNPDDASGLGHARYANRLYQENSTKSLLVSAMMFGERDAINKVIQKESLSFPILHDRNREWADRLGVHEQAHTIFLVNPNGLVEFVSPYAESEDLRQLVDKYVLAKASYYAEAGTPPLAPGDSLPAVSLTDATSGKSVSLQEMGSGRFAFLSAQCAHCALRGYLHALHGKKSAGLSGVVFSSIFTVEEVSSEAKAQGVASRLYVANDPISGIEDALSLRPLLGDDAVVVKVDRRGKLTNITRWGVFLNEQ
jgi:peroxiredoxin